MQEIIYVLTNEAMPGYVKIGKTTNGLKQRVSELSRSTSIPLPFTVFYACTVTDSSFVEQQLHDAFDNNRVNPRREFFNIDPERVVAALKLVEIEEITPREDIVESEEEQKLLNAARNKRSRFNFEMVGIPIGSEIYFSRNHNIKAKVVGVGGVNSIEFNGVTTSLSQATMDIMNAPNALAGTEYWMYDGETLAERRRRLEEES